MNTANKLTLLRVVMIPAFLLVLYLDFPGANYAALVIFALASITDTLDGYIARHYDQITDLGKFMDPLADKLLVSSAVICFVALPSNPMPAWVVIVIIAREFIISGFRLVAVDNGIVIAASWWGKAKTISQMIMIILLIANFGGVFDILETAFVYIAVVLTVVSLVDYIWKNRAVLNEQK